MLQQSARFLALPRSDRWLLLKATALVAGTRVATIVIPYRRLAGRSVTPASGSHLAPELVDHLAWAVTTASRVVPGGSCLPQALALQLLLNRRGEPSTLRLGVVRDELGRLRAHAWVECQDRTVIGGEVGHLTPLAPPHRAHG